MTHRLLIADDDEGLRAELRDLLQDFAYEVVAEASDGSTAVELARRLRPDVVLTDLKMPGLGGVEVAQALAGDIPVIILSAYDDPGIQAAARAARAAEYLVKGCRSTAIIAAIESSAGSRAG